MNMQKLFEKNENTAVIAAVTLFVVFHFGVLYLLDIVKI